MHCSELITPKIKIFEEKIKRNEIWSFPLLNRLLASSTLQLIFEEKIKRNEIWSFPLLNRLLASSTLQLIFE